MKNKYINNIRYYIGIIKKRYSKEYPETVILNFLLIPTVFFFLLFSVSYAPPDEWQHTSFVLEETRYRTSRGVGVLDLFTDDDRRFIINKNDEVLRYELVEGREYQAVYSDDLLYNTIKGLSNSEQVFLNADELVEEAERDKLIFISVVFIGIFILVHVNGICVFKCIRNEQMRIKKHKQFLSRKRHR